MKLNDFFDRIFVINLERRPDRLEKFKQMSDKIGFEYEIFPAVDGKIIDRSFLV